jgi:Ca-activated chloride channel homolog
MKPLAFCALLACVVSANALAGSWSDLWRTPEQQAQQLLDSNHAADAARLLKDPQRRGYAELRAGEYAQAAKSLAQLHDADSLYNRGNALAHTGQLREALAAYDAALAKSPGNHDVVRNRDLVARALEQQRKQSGGSPQEGHGGNGKQDPASQGQGAGSGQSGNRNPPGSQSQSSDRSQPGAQGRNQAGSQAQNRAGSQNTPAGQSGAQGQNQSGSQAQNRTAAQSAPAGQPGTQSQNQPGSQGQSPTGAQSRSQAGPQAQSPAGARAAQTAEPGARDSARPQAQTPGSTVSSGPSASNGEATPALRDNLPPGTESATARVRDGTRTAAATQPTRPLSEQSLALEQWLRGIPDDSAELLRRKFLIEHMMRQQGNGP